MTKSSGPDKIPARVFKHTSNAVAKSLKTHFYKIKQAGIYPDAWKEAVVAPVHKKGSKIEVKNYRQISLLPIASKVLERCIIVALFDHGWHHLHPSQYGFRKRRFCITQLLGFNDVVYSILNPRHNIDVIYTDFEKAFDNVDHQILIAKLHSFGVRGKLLKLLKSYLSNRTQKVQVRGIFSSSIPVASGKPQGSLLGPLLFLIFINDLPDSLQCFEPYLCDDDAKFLCVNTNKVLIETDLSYICNWSQLNLINFNVVKSVAMTFSGSSSLKNCQFVGALIVFAQEHKDLGLYIAGNLNWDAHVEEKCSKANKVFFMMKRNSPHIFVKSKLNLYKTMVLPIMMYRVVAGMSRSGQCEISKQFRSV